MLIMYIDYSTSPYYRKFQIFFLYLSYLWTMKVKGFIVPEYYPKTSLIYTLWHLRSIGKI